MKSRPGRGPHKGFVIAFATSTAAALACAHPSNAPTVSHVSQQHTAEARISTTSPLIVEWPAAERGRLETMMQKGGVAVHYSGASIEILDGCTDKNQYTYIPVSPKSEHLVFGSEAELDASFPLGALRLGAKLHTGSQLELTTRLVGRWELANDRETTHSQSGPCQKATHWIVAATVGAFRFYSSRNQGAGAQLGTSAIAGPGINSGAAEERSVLNSDGNAEQCAETSTQGPPRSCSALVRLELSPFRAPRKDLPSELGTLDFTPVELRRLDTDYTYDFDTIPFPEALCTQAQKELSQVRGQHRKAAEDAAEVLQYNCAAVVQQKRARAILIEKTLAALPQDALGQSCRLLLLAAPYQRGDGPGTTATEPRAEAQPLAAAALSPVDQLQTLADEHPIEENVGYWARYILAGSGNVDVEERNLRELIARPPLSTTVWPRMRLANLMLPHNPSQAVSLALAARNLTERCDKDRLSVLDWLLTRAQDLLSAGESFELQLDAVESQSAQGLLASEAELGQSALTSHDFETWQSAEGRLTTQPWALGALLWSEGAECYFRGNDLCAEERFMAVLEKAPHSPYVLPAYQAALRVSATRSRKRLTELSALRPDVAAGSELRKAIAEAPACGALDDAALQRALDGAQRLSMEWQDRRHASGAWEVDSLSAIAPSLSSCALRVASNGRPRLLRVTVLRQMSRDKSTSNPYRTLKVDVAPQDDSPETHALADCVEDEMSANALVFAEPFAVTVRVAQAPKISFNHGQGWPKHVRARFACLGGDDHACVQLGRAWLDGEELPYEPEQALSIFQGKCSEGYPPACVEEARLRLLDKKRVAEHPRAKTLLLEACNGGQGVACRLSAQASPLDPAGKPKDLVQYQELLVAGCRAAHPDPTACVVLWYAYQSGVLGQVESSYQSELLQTACRDLGDGAVRGTCETPADLMRAYPHRATKEIGELTCRRGVYEGCERAFIESKGAVQVYWAELGCEAGSPDACYWLSDAYRTKTAILSLDKAHTSLRRALALCKTYVVDPDHESVCEDPARLTARLAALDMTKKRSAVNRSLQSAKPVPSKK